MMLSLAPKQLLVHKHQSGPVTRLQIINSGAQRFAVDSNHPVDLVSRSLTDPANGSNEMSPHRHDGGEVEAGILCGGYF